MLFFVGISAKAQLPDNIENINCSYYPEGDPWSIENNWTSTDNVSVLLTPFVGDLDGDGNPEIVCFGRADQDVPSGNGPFGNKTIVVYDGVTKALKCTISMEAYITAFDGAPYGLVKLANNKGLIVVACKDYRLRAYDITSATPATPYWTSDQTFGSVKGDWAVNLAFADIDNDGTPEILVRNKIYDASNGKLLVTATGGSNTGSSFAHEGGSTPTGTWKLSSPIAANMDESDNSLEIILGNEIYKPIITNHDGTSGNSLTLWRSVTPPSGCPADGHAQVADFDMDGHLDVLVSVRGSKDRNDVVYFYLWDVTSNSVVASKSLTTKHPGKSIPLIADINGDGQLDIVIQCGPSGTPHTPGANNVLFAFTYDISTSSFVKLWEYTISFEDSFSNGTTCFDLNQDGLMELLISDMHSISIVNGSGKSHLTGNDTTAVYTMSSLAYYQTTIMQYPVVADVDNDGHAEIVAVGKDDNDSKLYGRLSVFKSAGVPWAAARPVWNQYMYNVTHVNRDLTIPQYLYNNASTFTDPDDNSIVRRPFNNFLQQATTLDNYGRPYSGIADIVADYTDPWIDEGQFQMPINYRNIGSATLPATFYATVYINAYGGRVIREVPVTNDIHPGDNGNISLGIPCQELCDSGATTLVVALNDHGTGIAQNGGQSAECNLDNNTYTVTFNNSCPRDTVVRSVRGCDSYSYLGMTLMRDTMIMRKYKDGTAYETIDGEDSVVKLTILISHSSSPTTISPNECDTYTWSTLATPLTFTTSTSKDTTLTNIDGCDSLVQLRLTIRHSTSAQPVEETACDSFTWTIDGNTYTEGGTHSTTLTNVAGCDSNITLILTINNKVANITTESACDSFYWAANDSLYRITSRDTLSDMAANGCDSLTILDLFVGHATTAPESVQTACDSFLWCGAMCYTSGHYSDTITNVENCDSIMSLTLTIGHNSPETRSDTGVCDSFLWDQTAQIYRASGTYSDTLANINGCDSVIVLSLTIQTSLEAPLLTSMICDEYTWSENGQIYTESGIYTDTLRSMYDCDSIVRIDLTILKSPQLRVSPDTTINICGKATIDAHGAQVYHFTPATALSQTLIYDTVAMVYANPRANTNYLITAYSLGPELIYNGDFTLGNIGFNTALHYATRVNGYGVYSIGNIARGVSDFTGKEHTTPSLSTGKFMVIDGSETANHLVWEQNVDVKPYTDYIFSFWATPVTTSTPAQLQAVINNEYTGDVLIVPSNAMEAGNWVQRYFIWNSGSSTTADIRIINRLGLGGGNDFGLDDISLRQLSCATEHHVQVNVHIDTIRQHVCDAYTWRETGMTYTESGQYDRHLRTTSGCDSLRVLDLVIANTNIDTDYVTTCTRHFWTLDSTMYTESGLYLWRTNHEEEGCDTFRYLRLTILDCDSMTLPDNVDNPWCTNPPPANAFEMREMFVCPDANTYTTPMVADLDGDGIPEIIYCHRQDFGGYNSGAAGNILVVCDGRNGAHKWDLNVAKFTVSGQLMSFADADGDGKAELYLLAEDYYLHCYSALGWGELWCSRERLDARYMVMPADVNGDGRAEIVCGPYIFDAQTGTLLLHGTLDPRGRGYGAPHTSSSWGRAYYLYGLSDIDFDNSLEICAGNSIYKPVITNNNGTDGNSWSILRQAERITQITGWDGQTFLADFDNDGDVDVCVLGHVTGDRVDLYVWNGQSSDIIGYYNVSMSGRYDATMTPSIPFAGDLDGNGTPEIIFNYPDAMRAFTYDPTLTNGIRRMHYAPRFGETAGFTVFDFNQDGLEEILYRNTSEMYIVDGTTLRDLCTPMVTYSSTICEYAIVADCNGDGHAEIIVCRSLHRSGDGPGELAVYCSRTQGTWGSARKVWNQWSYSSVNINEDLTVPRHQFDIAQTFPNGKKPFNGYLRQMPRLDQNGDIYMTVPDVSATGQAGIDYIDTGASVSFEICNHGENTLHSPYYITVYSDDYQGEIVKTFAINHEIGKDTCVIDTVFIPRYILCHVKADSLVIAINDAGYGVAQTGSQWAECDTTNNVVKIPFTPLVPLADTLRVTRCDKYVWAAIDTALYFSAVLNDTIPDHEGCDSVRWLELTINHSVFDTLDTLVCDIFQWRVNGEVYTTDKVQTEYFNTIHGCDSIHHLILEMHYRFDTTEYREACNTFYWPVDRRTYTRSATHAERMLTLYGCDSIHELILTVYHTYRDTMYDTICHYDSRAFGGHSYNMSGHYYDTVPMMRECDTIHELFLHVKQELPLEIDWTSQCEQLQYTIFAFNPRGDSLRGQINWQAFPVDHELDWQAYNDTVYVHPTLNTVYSATLYYNDGSPYLCPETRTVQLTPTQEVKAEINASTVCFTPDILDLRATADGSGFSVIEWFVDGNYYSGLKTIHYHYDPETATADSVRVTLRVSNGYCHDADTFMIHYLVGALHVPNIFSPSEERISRFKVTGTGITEYTIRIYNRQGLIVFESESLEDAWDGKLKDGTKAEQGAYVYLINYRTVLAPEELKVKTGTVVLLR